MSGLRIEASGEDGDEGFVVDNYTAAADFPVMNLTQALGYQTIGAALAGWLGTWIILLITAKTTLREDGAQGIVTIGAVEAWRMEEAKQAILNIVDPPKAELGKVYQGRVVNITKFGAFVNILPGRDGLVHISKLGGGRRINAVEDVLELGQEIEVKVDEIDDKLPVTCGRHILQTEEDVQHVRSADGGRARRSPVLGPLQAPRRGPPRRRCRGRRRYCCGR